MVKLAKCNERTEVDGPDQAVAENMNLPIPRKGSDLAQLIAVDPHSSARVGIQHAEAIENFTMSTWQPMNQIRFSKPFADSLGRTP